MGCTDAANQKRSHGRAARMRPNMQRSQLLCRMDAATLGAGNALCRRGVVMEAKWIFSSTFLPYTGEPIEFMLEEREQPIHGTFANGVFHSRWADYETDRVQSWRESEGEPSVALMATPQTVRTSLFITTLKRLSSMLSRGRPAAPIVPSRSHARTTTVHMPIVAMPPAVAIKRHIDSNQISS